MVSDEGLCKHVDHENGNIPANCFKSNNFTIHQCKESCTNHMPCVGYSYSDKADKPQNCRLFISINQCPVGYQYKTTNKIYANASDKLIGGGSPDYKCFAKNSGTENQKLDFH